MLKFLKTQNKTMLYGLLSLAFVLAAYIIGRQIVIPLIAAFMGIILISSSAKYATYFILLVTSCSQLYIYRETTFYIFVVAVYIMVMVFKGKFVKSSCFLLILTSYSLIFANSEAEFKIGSLTSVIYLTLAAFICENIERKDMREAVDYYIEGFAISTLFALFRNSIPALDKTLKSIYLVVEGDVVDGQSRFGGLFSDPNFYSAINCMAIAIILFANKKLTKRHILLLSFFIIVGFFTYSKSYILTLFVILAIYIIKSGSKIIKRSLLIVAVFVFLALIEQMLQLNILSTVFSRFENAETADELTTGRWHLWVQYMDYIFNDINVFLFGDGYNSRAIFKASHNTYIEFLFRFGVLGCAIWIWFFISCRNSCYKNEFGQKYKILTIMPLLSVAASFLFLSAFTFGYLGMMYAVCLFAMYMPNEEEQKCLN